MRFNLIIDDSGEKLYLINASGEPITGPHLFITSAILKSAWKVKGHRIVFRNTDLEAQEDRGIKEAINQAVTELTGQLYEELKPVSEWIPDDEGSISFEIISLRYVIMDWLSPLKKETIAIDLDKSELRETDVPGLMVEGYSFHAMAASCLKKRVAQVATNPEIINGKLVRLLKTSDILSLCWHEIWYCMEHDIKAKACPYCGCVFHPSPFHPNTAHCQSFYCKRKYIIEQKGGIEGYREWERERKQKRKGKIKE